MGSEQVPVVPPQPGHSMSTPPIPSPDPPPSDSPDPRPQDGLTYADLRRTVVLVFILLGVVTMAGPLTTLLLFFLLVFILAAVMNPVVVWLQKRGVPRLIGAIGIVVLVLAFFGTLVALMLPPLLDEGSHLFAGLDAKQQRIEGYMESTLRRFPALREALPPPEQWRELLSPHVGRLLGALGRTTINAVVAAASMLLMLVLVIFTVGRPEPLLTGLLSAVPGEARPQVVIALRRVLAQLKNWAFGSLVLGAIVGTMTGIGLWSVGMATGRPFPYILLFSVIAGIGEMIPNIGPILSAIPPALIAFAIDPALAVAVIILFFLIQQLENHLIVPVVMGQSLNLHPLSVTFTVLVMAALFGLLGAILAVPVCAIIKVCWEEFYLNLRKIPTAEIEQLAHEIATGGSPDPRDSPRLPQGLAVSRKGRRARRAETRRGDEG